jgi:LysR family transcriptional regulator, glycine cleavage system transcriptional activator
MRRLPPLNALRAFEAAARHLSFTRAAGELHVTQAAVSHQIRALEERLGRKLFRRVGRNLFLTDAAQSYLADVRAAFDRIDEATRRLEARDRGGVLNATVLPSFAAMWLLPRLGRFRAAYPEIDVRLSSDSEMVDFARSDFDIGIRTGRGRWPGLRSDLILTERLTVVCSPELAKSVPLKAPHDLAKVTLLHDEPRERWAIWFRRLGLDDVDPWRGPGFSHSNMVIQAAIAGQGVAVVGETLATDELKAGRLVRPFPETLPTDYSYYLVYLEAAAERPKIVAFREWVLAEAAAGG